MKIILDTPPIKTKFLIAEQIKLPKFYLLINSITLDDYNTKIYHSNHSFYLYILKSGPLSRIFHMIFALYPPYN